MGKSSAEDALSQVLRYTELLIYGALVALASLHASWTTRYALVALYSATAAFILARKMPFAATLLLSFPLLCVAHDLSNLYFAIASSLVACLTLFGPAKDKMDLAPKTCALLLLILTLGALSLGHPALNSVESATFVKDTLKLPHAKLVLGVSFGLALQWLSMQFLLLGTVGSFDKTEAVIISQLLAAFIPGALENSKHLSGSNGMAIVHFLSALAWTSFWIYEFITRLSQPRGAVLAITSTLAVILASIVSTSAFAFSSKMLAFFQKDLNFQLIGLWIVSFAAFSLLIAALRERASNTVIRKGFHFMALVMFLPAMVLDPLFLRTSLCLAIAVFFAVEFIRYSKLLGQAVSDFLTKLMNKVTNERDRSGPVTTSHVYLLVGCGFALIFLPEDQARKLALNVMSGPLIVLTIGDSFASIIGSKFGRHRWPSTSRTVEGTIAGILTTLGAMYILTTYIRVEAINWNSMIASVVLTFGLEAYTSAIDNLVLPIFSFTALSLIAL